MALVQKLYETPAERLLAFVERSLQPEGDWKEEVKDAWQRIERFFRDQCFRDELVLDQEVRVLKVVKGGSSGKGTTLNYSSDVDLVLFLSCFSSFQDQAAHRRSIISFIKKRLIQHSKNLAYSITIVPQKETTRVPRSLSFQVQARKTSEVIGVDVLPAYDALGHFSSDFKPSPEIYEDLITSGGPPGEFSPSFTELQRHFVKSCPVKLKNLLRMVKHWYLQCLKPKYRNAALPPKYAFELLTIYAWEIGTDKSDNFNLDEGFRAVMELLLDYEDICIYWTKYYDFQNETVRIHIKQQLKECRPVILDPADPTNNLGSEKRWDLVAKEAARCLRQACCRTEDPSQGWHVQTGYSGSEMAQAMELYDTPASKLDSFVAQWLQPHRSWKEEILEAVKTVQQFLREEHFEGDYGPDQEVRVLKVVKVGSFGNGTVLRNTLEVELVVFLSCFHSFQQEAEHHQAILSLIQKKLWCCRDLLALGLEDVEINQGVPDTLVFTIQTRRTAEIITVTIVPAYRALGPSASNSQPYPEVYESLIEAQGFPGNFSPSFSELQRNFVKHRPTKLKSLLRLVKHWYLQYVKAKCPRAALPPDYALELLTIYAWEMGTQEDESFRLDEGFTTVMELFQEYEFLCIYWTKYYTFQNPVIEDFVRKQLKRDRPIILDPADPTHNVAEGYRWDIVAQRARQCLKQDCCYDNKEKPVPSWNVKKARDIQVTVEQWGYSDLILRVNPYEPIKKIQEKMWQSRCCSGLQHLYLQELGAKQQLLSSQYSLADYGVFSNTRICLVETNSHEIQVFVKNPDGGSDAYTTDAKGFILGLKQQIEYKQGLPRKQQQLEFQGQVLKDWLPLQNYGIQHRDTLILSKKKAERFPFLPR
uniref:2'-5' oligoadenylate synthase n=2 Tax=Canis lupus TaxID=9612 RepID=A0A8C0P566_CANLF